MTAEICGHLLVIAMIYFVLLLACIKIRIVNIFAIEKVDGTDDEVKRHLSHKGGTAFSRLFPHADLHAETDGLAAQRLICPPVCLRIKGKIEISRIVEVEMFRKYNACTTFPGLLHSILGPHLRISREDRVAVTVKDHGSPQPFCPASYAACRAFAS